VVGTDRSGKKTALAAYTGTIHLILVVVALMIVKD
jgi:hypothetical protein